jgi:quinol monooxygenase YgiN
MPKTKRKGFGVVAHLSAQPSKVNQLRRHLIALTFLTQGEKGCVSCEMIENESGWGEFTLLEEWSNEETHNVHFASTKIHQALNSLSNLLSSELGSRQFVDRLNTVRYGTNCYNLGP